MPRHRKHVHKRPGEPFWARLPDERLLNVRLCDLGLKIRGTTIEPRIRQLYAELAERGLPMRPRCWLSGEWFSPHETPGIAVPFYLAMGYVRSTGVRSCWSFEGRGLPVQPMRKVLRGTR